MAADSGMSSFEGFKASLGGLFNGVLRQEPPPAGYQFQSRARAKLEQGSRSLDDKFGYTGVTRSVNYQLDRRGVPLDEHSADSLLANLKRANTLNEVNDLHRAEMAHFLTGRNERGNNYGSCIAGVLAHKSTLTILQISNGDQGVPEPRDW